MESNVKYPKLTANIIALAKEDPEFRKKLLADPQKTIQERVKFKLPDDFKILVHQDAPNVFNIVLPDYSSEELSEEQLSAVTGGLGVNEFLSSCFSIG
jgi:hypothetical protein